MVEVVAARIVDVSPYGLVRRARCSDVVIRGRTTARRYPVEPALGCSGTLDTSTSDASGFWAMLSSL